MELAKPAFPALPQAKEDSEVSGGGELPGGSCLKRDAPLGLPASPPVPPSVLPPRVTALLAVPFPPLPLGPAEVLARPRWPPACSGGC